MVTLSIFISIAFAGCAFLLYFLYALWREERKRPRVEIIQLPSRNRPKVKLLRLYSEERVQDRKTLT